MPFNNKTLIAVTLTIVNTAFLTWLAYLIFVIAVFYGMPLLIDFDPLNALDLYIKPTDHFFNLPEFFFVISITAVVAVFLGSCIYLSGSRAKLRQLFLLFVASIGLLSYSFTLCWLEKWVYKSALSAVTNYEDHPESPYHQHRVSELNKIIQQYEINNND